jgi:HEAT repeat protein
MALSMKDVRAVLDPEEPDYGAVAALGEDALPFLEELSGGDDPMLASKATYAASLIGGPRAMDTIRHAAHSEEAAVRVAAAAATSNLEADAASDVLEALVVDSDPGVRKVARSSVPEKASKALTKRLEELEDQPAQAVEPLDPATIGGLMPGEKPSDLRMPGEGSGLMPGEQSGDVQTAGETQDEMPG